MSETDRTALADTHEQTLIRMRERASYMAEAFDAAKRQWQADRHRDEIKALNFALAALRQDAGAEMRERCAAYHDDLAAHHRTTCEGLDENDPYDRATLSHHHKARARHEANAAAIRALPLQPEGRDRTCD